ncbi:MAG: hypothetical protein ACK5MW_09075 [Enterococcus sp.]
MYQTFDELNLNVTELPVEFDAGGRPVYRGFLRELPTITGEGFSKQEMYRQLAQNYEIWLEQHEAQESEEMTSSLLTPEQLLRYYDGETFDGFQIELDE